MSICRPEGKPAFIIFIRAAGDRGKIQIMSEEKRKNVSGGFVVCDEQEDYIEHLFAILSEQLPGEYQFHLFYDPAKMVEFMETEEAEVLLIGEEYRKRIEDLSKVQRIFVLTDIMKERTENNVIPVFRYQSASQILSQIKSGIKIPDRRISVQKNGRKRIRDEPETVDLQETRSADPRVSLQTRGLIGVYSPVHRIGKTRFAIRLGEKLSEQVPVLYINLEGYAGGGYYFPEETEYDLGDLIYCMKQERADHGLKISSMAGRLGGMDFIMPMENESDMRSVRGEEWISLFDQILEKCIYEVVILDLGDCIDGLYDILRNCSRVYTPYIREGAAIAKLEQYERNLRTTGYGDILSRTVKKQMQKKRHDTERAGTVQ